MSRKIDVESQERSLFTRKDENPQQGWFFIQKVYSIITFQFFLNIVAVSVVVFSRSVANFFNNTTQGFVLYIVLFFVPLITLCTLYVHDYYHPKHPLNYFLLLTFNISSAITIGLSSAFVNGPKILVIMISTTVMMFSLTLYTFWAAKRGRDINSLRSFLFRYFLVLVIFGFIQIPLGKFAYTMIYGCICIISIILCGYIVYFSTNGLIKEFACDQHIRAFVVLYLYVSIQLIFLFL